MVHLTISENYDEFQLKYYNLMRNFFLFSVVISINTTTINLNANFIRLKYFFLKINSICSIPINGLEERYLCIVLNSYNIHSMGTIEHGVYWF